MKTIIVATDFSAEAENALNYAASFAQKVGARIIIFNSFTIPSHFGNSLLPAEALIGLEEENQELLKLKCESLASRFGIETHYESSMMSEVPEELKWLYKKYEADLIVMGMTEKALDQDLFGNTTTSAIRKHSYPVLTVPPEAKFNGIRNILFAYDDVVEGRQQISDKIKLLADFFKAKIEIFHVNRNLKKECSRTILQEFEGSDYDFKEIKSDMILNEIRQEIKTLPADLLVMIPQKYNFWESIIHRSKTRIMASESAIPVLSIPLTS
ncbi:universal stress protein [Christiangramia fulva]|uniref:Universal stress protein n=1 Tax=Christiangramia fulva TaxID=2126553 RepID=A0A2R3Z9P4_9FLAO|nr:universal stress protein [Christiangramia fulva]AVR47013.1 universal stress protein [Christiangramia fulva]